MDISNGGIMKITNKRIDYTLVKGATYLDLPQFKVRFGFTLAEVLITLGIIGVVAAMTIPTLMVNYKAHQLHSQFLKSYSTIQQVFRRMEGDEVSLDPADYKVHASYYKTFAKYLTGATDCGNYGISCFGVELRHNYRNLKAPRTMVSGSMSGYLDDGVILIQDGTVLMFENCPWCTDNPPIMVTVDLNGFKNSPNRFGYDVFTFQLVDGELKTMGDTNTLYTDLDKYCNLDSNDPYNGIACAQKARSESDYFKWAVKTLR